MTLATPTVNCPHPPGEHSIRECDEWGCSCGNAPHTDGFYPCNRKGEHVEPTPEEWPENLYVCNRCKAIFLQDTGEFVGRATKSVLQVFLEKLDGFTDAATQLSAAFENLDNQDFACVKYPFAESFDEVLFSIMEWRDAVREQ